MKRALIISIALLPALVAAGVAQGGARARFGGTLRVAVPSAPQTFDPALATTPSDLLASGLLFETLVSAAPDGTLQPGLGSVPEPDAAGQVFRFRLRPEARFHGGAAVTAREIASSLSRIAEPALGSPYAVIAFPLAKGGVAPVLGSDEIQISLAFRYPDWPLALAHPAASIQTERKGERVGTGPFLIPVGQKADGLRYGAFEECPQGRAFADEVRLVPTAPKAIHKALSSGEAELGLLSTRGGAGTAGPELFATYLVLSEKRLGTQVTALRNAIESSVDPRGLTDLLVRAPATPMYGLLPPALDPSSARALPRRPRPSLPRGTSLTLISDASIDDHRAVGERLQVKLHDYGVALAVQRLSRADFRRALASGAYDLALVSFATIPEPGMALAQLIDLASRRDAARQELRAIGSAPTAQARASFARDRAQVWRVKLPIVPLYAEAPRLAAAEAVSTAGFDGAGVLRAADAWLLAPR
jgi:MarR-like DNA-binding transcriptional regulator SgrR of sgrS sRNA